LEVSDSLLCLYNSRLEKRGDSYVIEVPEREVARGDVEQGGVYRPPVGELVAELADSPAIAGAGQSSWGPAVYGVTDANRAEDALIAGNNALDDANLSGDVYVVPARNQGASVEAKEAVDPAPIEN